MENAYEIGINNVTRLDAYKKLIDFALDRSDEFMLISRYDFTTKSEFYPAKEETFEDKKQYLMYIN